ncbi:MaoC/PaaZ C-terminal domain-containing protein [Vibrio parahaemolyticus]
MHLEVSERGSYSALLVKALLKRADVNKDSVIEPFSLSCKALRFNSKKVNRYSQFFGFNNTSVPLPYLFVATQNEQLRLFTHPETCIRPLGLVHTYIEFEQVEALSPGISYQFHLSLSQQSTTDKGLTFEVLGEFYSGSVKVAQYRSGYLMPLTHTARRANHTRVDDRPGLKLGSRLTLTVSDARAYARLSGDYNPIHLFNWSARLFGFRRPIMHGMFLVARMYAEASTANRIMRYGFKRPVLLPQQLWFADVNGQTCLLNEQKKIVVEAEYH